MMRIKGIIILLGIFLANYASAQSVYFADGYHGGVFGHYPMWKTQFIVDKMALHPEWRINMEIEPETWDTVRLKEPQAYLNIKKVMSSPRVEVTNPTFAQPYLYNISGESMIRQFEYGIKKTLEHFPGLKFTTYSAEEPCFTSSLPQILKSFGFKYAVLKNPDTCWGGYTRAYGGQLVNWIGPDGTSMLTVPRYASEELEENSTWQTKAWNNSESYINSALAYGIENPIGMCFQDAGWKNGPWLGHGDEIRNQSIYTTWTNYIENVSALQSNDNWRVTQEDLLVNLMWGSQVLQRIAQEVRMSENKIITAEKIAAMAAIANQHVPNANGMDKAWRSLMLAQHHDSWIVPYNKLHGNVTWADEIKNWTDNTNKLSDQIIEDALNSYVNDNAQPSVRVYNALGVNRFEVVSIHLPPSFKDKKVEVYNVNKKRVKSTISQDGDQLILHFLANVPSFGYAVFSLKEGKKAEGKSKSGVTALSNNTYVLENDRYKLTLDLAKGGHIISLLAKKLGNKEFVDAKSNFSFGEIKGHFVEEEKFHSSTEKEATLTILEDNGLVTSIKLRVK